jgi:cyclopropane-fatty-acyl-phospholipid synthase
MLERQVDRILRRLGGEPPVPLRVRLWNGRCVDLSANPRVTLRLSRPSALRYFVAPDLHTLGEAFVDGLIDVEGPIHDVFEVGERLARNASAAGARAPGPGDHTRAGDRSAIAYHYDVSNEFYSLFLDREMVYSCAYYRDEGDSLERAQEQKLDHILNKLDVRPGERFLDIGCGWGALVRRAAERRGARAVGITLSANQAEHARGRIRDAGLQDRCSVELCDYRDIDGRYDKIASVGMFEHVGLENLPVYFGRIAALLEDDGLALNHGITTSDTDSGWMHLGAGEFIDRFVFPGGELPHLSLALKEMAAAGLEVLDVESLRRHYARTCREWADRLRVHRDSAVRCAGEKRVRIWEIYLAGCAYGFSRSWMNVYQVLATRAGGGEQPRLPLTRDYMYRASPG